MFKNYFKYVKRIWAFMENALYKYIIIIMMFSITSVHFWLTVSYVMESTRTLCYTAKQMMHTTPNIH